MRLRAQLIQITFAFLALVLVGQAAVTNFRFVASAVWTTAKAVKKMGSAAAAE